MCSTSIADGRDDNFCFLLEESVMKVRFMLLGLSLVFNVLASAQSGKSVDAATFPASDCGAKINAADAALGANPGEIVVTNDCGTSKWFPSALDIPADEFG
jgi:hypothetical protein